jgi:hypothetical protein
MRINFTSVARSEEKTATEACMERSQRTSLQKIDSEYSSMIRSRGFHNSREFNVQVSRYQLFNEDNKLEQTIHF